MAYKINPDCKSTQTEIYFNREMHYPDDFEYKLTPLEHVKMSVSDNGFLILLNHDQALKAEDLVSFTMYAFGN